MQDVEALVKRQGNFYSSNWSDGKGQVKYTSGAAGKYSVTWGGNKGNFVCGKGWSTGGDRKVEYSGTFAPNGNAYLAIYGWTTNPLVEYYIIEAHGTHHPSDSPEAKVKGNMTSDGGTYEIMTKQRVNKPSIQGTATFAQFWSIRFDQQIGGTVTTGNHFKAWKEAGLKLGTHNYMIVAVEGQDSNGTASITVGVPPAPAAT
ncbi:concanavalin A-like lectin/glucanase domain-containing protein [Halenospora varia]|nr:concanavalin A-like lectin/glucanase domain-containing protein [Halenospora varia]